jgi:hypothetical protein
VSEPVEGCLVEAARVRVRGAVKTGGSVGDPDEARVAAGSRVGVLFLGLVLLPV